MKKNNLLPYNLIAYGWSWFFWGAAILISLVQGSKLPQNADFLAGALNGSLTRQMILPLLLSLTAVYGPLLGFLFVRRREGMPASLRGRFHAHDVLLLLGILLGISVLPAIPVFILSGVAGTGLPGSVLFIPLFLVYQMLTSGTEEFGWRGFLLEAYRKRMTLWQASVRSGFIWAFWHTPIVLYMFYAQGMTLPQMLSSFAGFVAGIVGMSTFLAWWKVRTKSLLFMVLAHALANTIPMVIGYLAGNSLLVSIAPQLLIWLVVILIEKFDKTVFREVPAM